MKIILTFDIKPDDNLTMGTEGYKEYVESLGAVLSPVLKEIAAHLHAAMRDSGTITISMGMEP